MPTIYAMLAALPNEVQPDTSSLRFAICGVAPAAASTPSPAPDAPAPSDSVGPVRLACAPQLVADEGAPPSTASEVTTSNF